MTKENFKRIMDGLEEARRHAAGEDVPGMVIHRPERPAWHTTPPTDLEATIAEFKAKLPGWWYSVCECQVSCDASCAPTSESPDINRITAARDCWDSGFHADLRQPSSLAAALRDVMEQALEAITEDGNAPPGIEAVDWADKIARALDADPIGDFDTIINRTVP